MTGGIVKIDLPIAVGLLAASSGCCCSGLFDRLGIGTDETTVVPAAPEAVAQVAPQEGAGADDDRLLKGDLAVFPDFEGATLKSLASTPTITSAILTVPSADHKAVELVAFYRKAALDKGYFIDSEIAEGPEPSFQAIRGNIVFRVVAERVDDVVQCSLTTERTL